MKIDLNNPRVILAHEIRESLRDVDTRQELVDSIKADLISPLTMTKMQSVSF